MRQGPTPYSRSPAHLGLLSSAPLVLSLRPVNLEQWLLFIYEVSFRPLSPWTELFFIIIIII